MADSIVWDISEAYGEWEQPTTIETVTTTTEDFEESEDSEQVTSDMAVWPTSPKDIKVADIDFSLEYFSVVAREDLSISITPGATNIKTQRFLIKNGKRYKFIASENFSNYGFFISVAEEVK